MSDWTTLTDAEKSLIKIQINKKFDKALKITLAFTVPLCLYSPYIPRKNGTRQIDTMDYLDAVILFSIFWICCIIIVYFLNEYKIRKQYEKALYYLRKKEVSGEVIILRKSFLSRYPNVVKTVIENDLVKFFIDRDLSDSIKVGDKLKILMEESTKTILAVEKI